MAGAASQMAPAVQIKNGYYHKDTEWPPAERDTAFLAATSNQGEQTTFVGEGTELG